MDYLISEVDLSDAEDFVGSNGGFESKEYGWKNYFKRIRCRPTEELSRRVISHTQGSQLCGGT